VVAKRSRTLTDTQLFDVRPFIIKDGADCFAQ